MILQAWDPRYLDALTKRVTVGHAARAVRQAAIACLVEHAPEELTKIGRNLIANDDINRLVEIAIDLAYLRNGRMSYAKRHECAASSALATLPSAFKELSDADLALAEGKHFVLSAKHAPYWKTLGVEVSICGDFAFRSIHHRQLKMTYDGS